MSDFFIHQGDCLDYMRTMDEASIDLTVTSPPYDNMRTYNGYSFDFEQIAQQLYRVTKPGGVLVWVVGDETVKGSETGTSFRQALFFMDVCGFRLADTMIYHKTDLAFPRFGHRKYPAAFEYMFVFSKGPIKTFNLIKDRKNKLAGSVMSGTVRQEDGSTKPSRANGKTVADFGARSNVWGYSTGRGKSASDAIAYDHPAIFPEALARDHILSWSEPGDIVFDPFTGSGTTAKQSVISGRSFVGCEISEDYVAIAQARVLAALEAMAEQAKSEDQRDLFEAIA